VSSAAPAAALCTVSPTSSAAIASRRALSSGDIAARVARMVSSLVVGEPPGARGSLAAGDAAAGGLASAGAASDLPP